jgi:hypothetical protein
MEGWKRLGEEGKATPQGRQALIDDVICEEKEQHHRQGKVWKEACCKFRTWAERYACTPR